MLKLIIADDERIIRETISTLIDWKSLGIELIGLCKDGIEAYHMILDEIPDIVLTDIKMPGLSGLELIEKISQTDSVTQFVILSGFGEFEYAKAAMRYGVRHYLLKPCNETQIIDSMRAVIQEHQHQKAFRQMHEKQRRLLKTFHSSIMTTLITEGISSPDQNTELFKTYQNYFDFVNTRYELCYIYYLERKSLAEYLTQLQRFQQMYSPGIPYYGVYVKNTLMIYFECYQESFDSLDRSIHWITTTKNSVSLEYKRVSYENLSILLNNVFSKIRRYEKLYCISDFKIVPAYNHNLMAQISNLTDNLLSTDHYILEDLISELRSLLTNIDDIAFLKQIISNLMLNLASKLPSFPPVAVTEFLLQLNQIDQIPAIVDAACTTLSSLLSKSRKTTVYSAAVEDIIIYVENNLDNPSLTLKWIAENHLYMNVDYISKRFIKETGIKFSNYLADARIKKAKSLLSADTTLKISYVAEQVGCGYNPQYFSQIFKKNTGLTPSEYIRSIQSF